MKLFMLPFCNFVYLVFAIMGLAYSFFHSLALEYLCINLVAHCMVIMYKGLNVLLLVGSSLIFLYAG